MTGTPALDTQSARLAFPRSKLTALILSGTLFDRTENRGRYETLRHDVAALAHTYSLRPDLLIMAGDLAANGLPREYKEGLAFLGTLVKATGISRRHVAIVPGSHDVNRKACEGYFLSKASREEEPEPPYSPKWEQFARAFDKFYANSGIEFNLEEPWTLFDMRMLGVTVAGLNSTMAESHEVDYGSLTQQQLRWFAAQLAERQDQGYLRLAAVHRTDVQDAPDLDQILGKQGLVNLLISGQHDGTRTLRSGLPVLATGSIGSSGRYQLITMSWHGFDRYARLHDDETGWQPEWEEHTDYPITDAPVVFPGPTVSGLAARRPTVPDSLLAGPGTATAPGGPPPPVYNIFNVNGPTTIAQRDALSAGNDIRGAIAARDDAADDSTPGDGTEPRDPEDAEGQP